MRHFISILILCSFFYCSLGQNQKQMDTWFFGTPLNESPKNIQDWMDSNSRIIKISKKQVVDTSKFPGIGYMFFGKIISPVLLNSYLPDSIKISLGYGISNEAITNKYMGKSKVVTMNYIFSDSVVLRKVYETAVQDLTVGLTSKRKAKRKMTYKNMNAEGFYFYFKNKKRYKRGEIFIQHFNNSIHALTIRYIAYLK